MISKISERTVADEVLNGGKASFRTGDYRANSSTTAIGAHRMSDTRSLPLAPAAIHTSFEIIGG
jgi:hypothetical protein